jgi:hypothetical protein
MSRTTALSAMLMLLAPVACTTMVRPGLANAPASSGPAGDARVQDVIANGGDSCERRLGPGPLRNEVPPCAIGRSASDPADGRRASNEKQIAAPWVEHYYTHWPCSSRDDDQVGRATLAGSSLASPAIASNGAFRGATCAAPWDGSEKAATRTLR